MTIFLLQTERLISGFFDFSESFRPREAGEERRGGESSKGESLFLISRDLHGSSIPPFVLISRLGERREKEKNVEYSANGRIVNQH